jgi:hypothetical protein
MTEEDRIEVERIEADFDQLGVDDKGFFLTGLRDVQGTFEGSVDAAFASAFRPGPVELTFYGPDPHLRWYRHWFYRLRERVTGTPYPTIPLASGPATFTVGEAVEEGDDVVIRGSFTSAGTWYIDP